MKKSIKNLATKSINNTQTVKGGGFGKGTKKSTTSTSARPELM